MDYTDSSLIDLLQNDAEANQFFKTLPPEARKAMFHRNISSIDELRSKANDMIYAPY